MQYFILRVLELTSELLLQPVNSLRPHATGNKSEQHHDVTEAEGDPDYEKDLVGEEVTIFKAVVDCS